MKGKAIIPLVLGLCVGLVAVKYLFDTLQKAKGANADRQLTSLVRARQDIDSLELLTPDKLEVIEIRDSSLAPAHELISSLDVALGRVTAKAIPQHSPVLQSMLAAEGTPAGMVGRIPPGFRAVSVKIDEVTGVAYQLKPGDWVDVIVVMDVDTGRARNKETIAEVILEHVQVAAIGQATNQPQTDVGAQVKPAKSATLLVPEEDVPKLHLVQTRGKITLSMRGEDDTMTGRMAKATSTEVFGYDYLAGGLPAAPPPVAAPPALAQTTPSTLFTPPEPEPPHNVTVYLGSITDADPVIQQFTFENDHSRTVVALSEGPVNRNSAYTGRRYARGSSRPAADNAGHEPSPADKDQPSADQQETE